MTSRPKYEYTHSSVDRDVLLVESLCPHIDQVKVLVLIVEYSKEILQRKRKRDSDSIVSTWGMAHHLYGIRYELNDTLTTVNFSDVEYVLRQDAVYKSVKSTVSDCMDFDWHRPRGAVIVCLGDKSIVIKTDDEANFKDIHSTLVPAILALLITCGAPRSVSASKWTCSPNTHAECIPVDARD